MASRYAGHAMGLGEAMKIAGLGCRSGVSVHEVLAALTAALAEHGLECSTLTALATIPARAQEPALQEAARLLGLPLTIPFAEDLQHAETLTHSTASLKATDLASASEAAAIAAVGRNGILLGPRLVIGNITCAIAICKEGS